jgi:CheY-like chemotaxis protein
MPQTKATLIVDDDEVIRRLVHRALSGFGYVEVLEAADAAEALEIPSRALTFSIATILTLEHEPLVMRIIGVIIGFKKTHALEAFPRRRRPWIHTRATKLPIRLLTFGLLGGPQPALARKESGRIPIRQVFSSLSPRRAHGGERMDKT